LFFLLEKDIHLEASLEEDEQLARAIQESLNVELPRKNGSASGGNIYQPPRKKGSANGSNTYQPPCENGTTNGGNTYQPLPFMFSSGFRFLSLFVTLLCKVLSGYADLSLRL
jgi:hypothetical protein